MKILRELIKDEALVTIKKGPYGKPQVILVEPQNQGKHEYSVVINAMPHDSIVIKTDVFPAPKHIFNCSRGECKRADFVIITNTKNQKLIIFIELKKGKGKTKEIAQQLKGSQCVVDYFKSIVNVFWEQKDFLKHYEYRFVSIRNIGIDKKPTSKWCHDIHKFSSSKNIEFKKLICKCKSKS